MEPFLKETLRTIVAAHPGGLANVTLVFNNRRPTLFVKHYLREMLGETFFLPQTIVFDDLIAELGDNELVPNEFLLFELYDIHRRINPTDKRTLDQFMPMADMMLADFSEVDRYMVDVKDIYGNLHDLKEIGEWQIDNNKLTPFQRDYLKFYKALYPMDEVHQAQYKKAQEKAARPRKEKKAPFTLYIDADGCPVINQALNAANRRRVKCYLICDTAHSFSRRGAETIVVDKGADSTDFKIVELVQPGDLVLTQDYGLAAMCLARQARVIDQNGMRYTSENIQSLLTGRAESARLRRGGFRTKGPSKRTGEQNEAFVNAFHEMIQEAYDAAKKGEEAGELQSKENADG